MMKALQQNTLKEETPAGNIFRTLHANEIEVRVRQVHQNGKSCDLVLYIDARAGMKMLDEQFGNTGWQREQQCINNALYCTISIWDEAHLQWVRKQDVGSESNIEKEKGQSTDAFKRACVVVGIGRELYTAPDIFIWLKPDEVRSDKNNRFNLDFKVRFSVSHIAYDEHRNISELQIVDQNGEVRFNYPNSNMVNNTKNNTQAATSSFKRTMDINNFVSIDEDTGEVHESSHSNPLTMPKMNLEPVIAQSKGVPQVNFLKGLNVQNKETTPAPVSAPKAISSKQLNRLYAIGKSLNMEATDIDEQVYSKYGVPPTDLTLAQYNEYTNPLALYSVARKKGGTEENLLEAIQAKYNCAIEELSKAQFEELMDMLKGLPDAK